MPVKKRIELKSYITSNIIGINGENAINALYFNFANLNLLNNISKILKPRRKMKNSLRNKLYIYKLNLKFGSNASKNIEL